MNYYWWMIEYYSATTSIDRYRALNIMIDNYHKCAFDMGGWYSVCKGWDVPENNNR